MDIKHVAALANLTLTSSQAKKLPPQFTQTLDTLAIINELDTQNVEPTSQVTGLINITRPDKIDPSRILSQASALSQAPRTHAGYFVVPSVLDAQ